MSKVHEYLVNMFDSVADALAAEREGHYLQVLACCADIQIELQRTSELAQQIQERNEMASK